jgi:hypothetical protein
MAIIANKIIVGGRNVDAIDADLTVPPTLPPPEPTPPPVEIVKPIISAPREIVKPSMPLPVEIFNTRKRKIEHKPSSYMQDITTIQK